MPQIKSDFITQIDPSDFDDTSHSFPTTVEQSELYNIDANLGAGIYHQSVDIYNENWSGKDNGIFQRSLVGETLHIIGNGSGERRYNYLDGKIVVNGTAIIEIEFYTAREKRSTITGRVIETEYIDGASLPSNQEISIPISIEDIDQVHYLTSFASSSSSIDYCYYVVRKIEDTPVFTEEGNYDINFQVKVNSIFNKTIKIGTVEVLGVCVDGISLDTTNAKTKYYKNEYFTYAGLVVMAHLKYAVSHGDAYSTPVTGYSVTVPDIVSSGAPDIFITTGVKMVNVHWSGYLAAYSVQVYGIESYTTPTIKSIRNTDYFRVGEAGTVAQIEITYDGLASGASSLTESISVTHNLSTTSAGEKVVTYSATSTRTHETIQWSSTVTVYGVASLTLNTTNVTKNFYKDDTFSYSDLVVTAHYGTLKNDGVTCNDEAGTETLSTGSYTVTPPEWTVGASKDVTVSYGGASTTYKINVNGLTAIAVNIEACDLYSANLGYFRIPRNGTFTSVGKVVNVKRLVNGVESEWTSYTLSIDTTLPDLSTVTDDEERYVTFSLTEHGVTVSDRKQIVVYAPVSLSINKTDSNIFIPSSSSLPTFSIANLSVVATNSDGTEDTLTYDANTKGYLVKFTDANGEEGEVGDTLSLGENIVTVYSKSETNVKTTYKINVIVNTPKVDGNIRVNGDLTYKYVKVGETIKLDGVKVEVELQDGTYQEVDDYEVVIDGKEGLVFDNSDTKGIAYDLVFTASNYNEDSFTLEDAITLDDIDDIKNVVISKTLYDIGEVPNADDISYSIKWLSENDYTNNKTGGISDLRTTPFAFSEAGDSTGAGTVTLSFKIQGVSKTLDVTVRRAVALKWNTSAQTNYVYKKGDALSPTSHKFSLSKVYNDENETEVPLTSEEMSSEDFGYEFYNAESPAVKITACSENNLVPDSDMTRSNSAVVKVYPYLDVYGGEATLTVDPLQISVLAIRNVKLYEADGETEVTKLYYDSGDLHSLVGLIMVTTLNNQSTIQTNITSSFDSCSPKQGTPIISSSAISGSVTYSYSDTDQASATFTIHNHYLYDIVTNMNDVVESTYYSGDTFDLSDLVVKKKYKSTDNSESGYPLEVVVDDPILSLNGGNVPTKFSVSTDTTYTFKVTVGNIEKTKSILVKAVVLSSVTLTTDSSWKNFNSYIEDQNLTLAGLIITRTYNNGSTSTIPYTNPNVQLVDSNGDAVSKTLRLDKTRDNGRELFISYNENGSQLNPVSIGTLTVGTKALTSIEIVQNPNKTTFTYGDVFSINGLSVKANFNNGSSELTDLSELDITNTSNFDIGDTFEPDDDPLVSNLGTITVSISYTYGGVTATAVTFNVSLVAPTIDHLETNADSAAVQIEFIDGQAFNTTGLIVTAVMTNGWETALSTFTTNASTVLNLDGSSIINCTGDYGIKTITIGGVNPYNENDTATTTYNVNIITSGAVKSAYLVKVSEEDKHYLVGEKFTAKGIMFHVTDIDNNEYEASNFESSLKIGTLLRSAQKITVKVKYVNGTFAKEEEVDIVVDIPYKTELTEEQTYAIAIGVLNGDLFTELTREEATIKLGKQYEGQNLVGEYYPIFKKDLITVDNTSAHTNTYGYNVYKGTMLEAKEDWIGYMDMGLTAEDGTVIRQSHIVLFDDPLNPVDGQSNIEVLFPHYVSGYADRINKCRFGMVFNNRLFVSGNPNYPNCDWHTSAINVGQISKEYTNKDTHDYTYFSDLDYCYYGNEETAIVGYDIYRDGDLIVVKKGSRQQATLYRRTYKLVTAMSYDGTSVGDSSLAEESFPMFDININGGDGGLSNRTIINFIGETLILTKNGLKALTSKEEVYNNAKYTYKVSSYIDPKITNEDLDNAILFSFKEKLLLKTSRGLYVGYQELRNENNEYEWYFLNNIDADLFFEFDDELYFANNKGELYRFPVELIEYADKSRKFVGVAGAYLQIDETNNKIIAGSAYKDYIKEGSIFHLITSYNVGGEIESSQVYASLGNFVNRYTKQNILINGGTFDQTAYHGLINAEDGYFEIITYESDGSIDYTKLNSIRDLFYEGREVYFDNIVGNAVSVKKSTKYKLKQYDTEMDSTKYSIVDESGNTVSLVGIDTIRMSFIVNNEAATYITDVQDYGSSGAKQFKLLGDHERLLDLIYYNNIVGNYSGVITSKENVNAFYETAPYAFGTLMKTKTIWQWIIANDTQLKSYMDVGYFASRKQGDYRYSIKTSADAKQLDFSTFHFEKVQFDSDKLPHIYTKYRTVGNVNFIRFLFRNDKDSNMVLTTLEVTYTISQFTKGAK